uniref:Secreted protein n=1 Tax=Opuntia streptacantha TaxID=393608 RepID=A0A7C9DQA4_OPUST
MPRATPVTVIVAGLALTSVSTGHCLWGFHDGAHLLSSPYPIPTPLLSELLPSNPLSERDRAADFDHRVGLSWGFELLLKNDGCWSSSFASMADVSASGVDFPNRH